MQAASISLLLRDREWFKAIVGWSASELPLKRSLVAALRQSTDPVIVPDLRNDPSFRDHPLVVQQPGSNRGQLVISVTPSFMIDRLLFLPSGLALLNEVPFLFPVDD